MRIRKARRIAKTPFMGAELVGTFPKAGLAAIQIPRIALQSNPKPGGLTDLQEVKVCPRRPGYRDPKAP